MIEGDAVERDDCAAAGDCTRIGDCTRTRISSLVTEGESLAAESGGLGCSSPLGTGDPPAADICDCTVCSGTDEDGSTVVVVWESLWSSRTNEGDARDVEGSECCRFPLRAATRFASPSSRILLSVALIRSGCMPSGKPLPFGAMSDISSSELDGGLGGSRESKVSGSSTRLAITEELSVLVDSLMVSSR